MTKKYNERILESLYMLIVFLLGCVFLYSSNFKNDLIPNDITISIGVVSIVFSILYFIFVLINIICNQSKHKNPISTSVNTAINTEHPVIHEIQNIISNLSKLETNNKNRKAIFIKFNVIKQQFYVDYQKTIDMLAKLDKTKQNENQYWESFRRYLDLFKEQKDIIYKKLT